MVEIVKKRYFFVFASLFVLVGCNTNKTQTNTEESASNSTTIESSSFDSAESINSTSVTEEGLKNDSDFAYSVNINDFTKEVVVDKEGDKEKTYNKDFTRNKQTIVINMKDLNDYGKGIYISPIDGSTGDTMSFYPISIIDKDTNEIEVKSSDGQIRNVKVNTEFTFKTFPGNEDLLNLVGKKGYLFYNDQGTISIAFPDVDEFVEFIERTNTGANDGSNDNTGKESNLQNDEKRKEYYDLIYQAWDKQRKYIESIEDPQVKQSVQTSFSAAMMESTRLMYEFPDDAEIINEALQLVLKP